MLNCTTSLQQCNKEKQQTNKQTNKLTTTIKNLQNNNNFFQTTTMSLLRYVKCNNLDSFSFKSISLVQDFSLKLWDSAKFPKCFWQLDKSSYLALQKQKYSTRNAAAAAAADLKTWFFFSSAWLKSEKKGEDEL